MAPAPSVYVSILLLLYIYMRFGMKRNIEATGAIGDVEKEKCIHTNILITIPDYRGKGTTLGNRYKQLPG